MGETVQLINASAHCLPMLADGSVHMVATSPPYWGLRRYDGEQAVDWPAVDYAPMPGLPALSIPAMSCGLGEEPTPEAFIGHLILVMREMWRVLRDDGTAWVNLGDSYTGSANSGGEATKTLNSTSDFRVKGVSAKSGVGLKPKDLCAIPWRFALAAQADGWYLRSDIIWAKPNPMPESVTDRPTKSHEYVFLLAKSQRYFYDHEAVKENSVDPEGSAKRYESAFNVGAKQLSGNGRLDNSRNTPGMRTFTEKRNRRTVWNVPIGNYKGAHFATWPIELVRPMILAGTSARGVCPACGAPWERVTNTVRENYQSQNYQIAANAPMSGGVGKNFPTTTTTTTGWQPTCECPPHDPIPATVLDPFNGSGTTGTVALDLGRAYIGVDISAKYVHGLAEERIGGTQIGMGL